jgi:signal transduction histidine kinase/ActR/RegA family two-component response regulator
LLLAKIIIILAKYSTESKLLPSNFVLNQEEPETMSLPSCSIQAQHQADRQVRQLSDPICASYRSKSQCQQVMSTYLQMGHQSPRFVVIGQRRDLERFSRYAMELRSEQMQVDTWIPLDMYSTFPSKSLQRKLENLFAKIREGGSQPVLCMEATDFVNRWHRETATDAVMAAWVEWTQRLGVSMLALFHHPGLENCKSLSLLQPFPMTISKGKHEINPHFVPQCPARSEEPRYCQKKIIGNLENLANSVPVNGDLLRQASRLLHYYIGLHRANTVVACLEPTEIGNIEISNHNGAFNLFPLDIPGHPNAAIVVMWNKGAKVSPDDQHLLQEAVKILSQRFCAWRSDAQFRRMKNMTERLLRSTSSLVLGMADDGSISTVSGNTCDDLVAKIIRHFPEAFISRARESFALGHDIEGHELTVSLYDAPEPMTFWVEGHSMLDDPLGEYLGLIVLRDVTEDRKVRSDLLQLQKQDTLRVMSGGITHDLNNVLSAVMGYASYLSMRLSPDDPLREDLAMIEKSTGKAADLVRRLLGFARRSTQPTGLVDPNSIGKEISRLLEPALNGSYTMDLQLSDDAWPILGDGNQIQQAIMNLCLNAKSAMVHGGTITVTTKNVVVCGDEPGFRSLKPGLYVEISVADNGTGIPRDIRRKIFDPFFTTKPVGKGTGLGLTMVQMITKNHGGRLILRSQKNKGTTVSLLLPATAKSSEEAKPVHWVLQRGKEGILLVDDEPSIVDMGVRILRDHGYRVYTASSIDEAEETLVRHIDDIDLALLDVVSTEEDGILSSKSLQELSPDLKVVLFSGYPQESDDVPAAKLSHMPFVQKPFRARDLLETVRRTLDDEFTSMSC